MLTARRRRQQRRAGTQRPVEVLSWKNDRARRRPCSWRSTATRAATRGSSSSCSRTASGVTATEYPQSEGEDVVGPTVFGHAGAAAAIAVGAVRYNNSAKPGELLLARAGHPLLRPGRRRRAGRRAARTRSALEARPGRHRLRRDHLLRQLQRRRLALLRHLGGGPARRRRGGAAGPGRARGDAAGDPRRDGGIGAAGRLPTGPTRSAPGCSTPAARWRASASNRGGEDGPQRPSCRHPNPNRGTGTGANRTKRRSSPRPSPKKPGRPKSRRRGRRPGSAGIPATASARRARRSASSSASPPTSRAPPSSARSTAAASAAAPPGSAAASARAVTWSRSRPAARPAWSIRRRRSSASASSASSSGSLRPIAAPRSSTSRPGTPG